MAQIVFLNDITQSGDEVGYTRTVGPYVLSAKLRQAGFSCVVVDRFTYLDSLFEILENVISEETLFVGISATFLGIRTPLGSVKKTDLSTEYNEGYLWCDDLEDLKNFIQKIRQLIRMKNSKARLVLGGGKALRAVFSPDMNRLFDFYVIGKAESFIVALVHLIKSNQNLPFSYHHEIPYLAEENFKTETTSVESLLWTDSDAILPGESLPIEVAKGCSYNCKFCHFDKQKSIRQDTDKLKEQIIRNYENYGTTVYYFCDDCFNDTRPKVEAICEALISLPFKIDWVSFVRVDIAVKFPHTLDLMVQSGARGLYWGLETFNHKVGKVIGKGTDPEQIKEMLVRLKSTYGDRVLSTGSFIVGLPGEDEESLWKTNQWLIDSKALDDVSHFVLALVPYSEKFDKAAIDYADFSKNPQKYGFKKISFNPLYWEHDLMDRNQALMIRKKLMDNLAQNNVRVSYAQSVFQYPYFRSLGYSHQQIVEIYKSQRWGSSSHKEVLARENEMRKKYEELLRAQLGMIKPALISG